jgi:hypothetical protein
MKMEIFKKLSKTLKEFYLDSFGKKLASFSATEIDYIKIAEGIVKKDLQLDQKVSAAKAKERAMYGIKQSMRMLRGENYLDDPQGLVGDRPDIAFFCPLHLENKYQKIVPRQSGSLAGIQQGSYKKMASIWAEDADIHLFLEKCS